jgi:phospholipase D1/2
VEDRIKYSKEDCRPELKRSPLRPWIILLSLLALPAIWRWTPLNQWINFAAIAGWQDSVRSDPAAPLIVVAIYVLGSLVFFPVTILTLATVFTFGPIWGNIYGLGGWMLSAAAGYGIGRVLGGSAIVAPRLDRLIRPAARHGFSTVLTVRLLPVAPFTLVNLFIGASTIRFRDFLLASLVGRIPGIVALTLFGVHLESALRTPAVRNFVLLGLIVILILLAGAWLSRRAGPDNASHR